MTCKLVVGHSPTTNMTGYDHDLSGDLTMLILLHALMSCYLLVAHAAVLTVSLHWLFLLAGHGSSTVISWPALTMLSIT